MYLTVKAFVCQCAPGIRIGQVHLIENRCNAPLFRLEGAAQIGGFNRFHDAHRAGKGASHLVSNSKAIALGIRTRLVVTIHPPHAW
jgi:hypothetical protein